MPEWYRLIKNHVKNKFRQDPIALVFYADTDHTGAVAETEAKRRYRHKKPGAILMTNCDGAFPAAAAEPVASLPAAEPAVAAEPVPAPDEPAPPTLASRPESGAAWSAVSDPAQDGVPPPAVPPPSGPDPTSSGSGQSS